MGWLREFALVVSIDVQTVTPFLRKIPLTTWLFGFLGLLIYQALDSGLNEILQKLFRSTDGTPNWAWFIAALSVLLNLVFPLGITFWLLSSVKSTRSWCGDFQQLLIETLRLWGKIFLYCFALIIPGIWKWASSIFVPYVVLFSAPYSRGEADAILQSKTLFKKVWLRALLILLIFSIVIPYILTANFDQYRLIWDHPMGSVLLSLAEYICLIISLSLLFLLFNKASQEVNHELVF